MTAKITPANLLAALNWRYATKVFDPTRKIPADTWATLEQSLILAPSSFGLQPWKFFVINNPAIRAQLRVKAWNQAQVTDASHYVVIARRTEITPADIEKYFAATSAPASALTPPLAAYKNVMLDYIARPDVDTCAWAACQAYIPLGFLLSAAALLEIDACPMEGLDAPAYNEILGLPALGYHAQVSIALGYRAPTDKQAANPKVRYPHSDLIQHI